MTRWDGPGRAREAGCGVSPDGRNARCGHEVADIDGAVTLQSLGRHARIAHDDVQFQTLLGNGYVGGDPSSAQLSRFNDFAHDSAIQADLDSSLEYRFATGPVQLAPPSVVFRMPAC